MNEHKCGRGYDHHGDPLTFMERDGMTVWGRYFSAQVRDRGELALVIMDFAPTSHEEGGPVLLPAGDVEKLRALLNEEASRRSEGAA